MKATKDFFIHDNEVRLSAESDGGCVSKLSGIVRGRISVILSVVVLMLFLWLMVSCSDSKEQEVLNHVEAVIEAHPDSALTLLCGVDKASLGSDKERARYALLMSMALDKNYIDTTSFDVIQPAIEYYLDRDKGTPDDKLRTYYYQGRIFQNQGDRDNALNSFVKGLDMSSESNDSLTVARTFVASGGIYDEFYDFDSYTTNYLKAAVIYKDLSLKWNEFDCLLNALDGAILLGNKPKGDSIMALCNGFGDLDNEQKLSLPGYRLSHALKFEDISKIKQLIEYQEGNYNLDTNGLLNLAKAYYKLGDYVKAKNLLNHINNNSPEYDILKYQAILVPVLENIGDYKGALTVYKEFSHSIDSINTFKFDQKAQTIEEKHKLELKAQYDARQKDWIIWGCVGLAMLLCIVILVYALYVKRLKVEHTSDLLQIQNLQNNLFERDRRQEEVSGKIESLFSTRFKLLDGLASSYFECKETGQEQKRIYAEVKNSIVDFSSDATTQELIDIVNGYKSGLMDNFKADYPKLSASQYRLALYLFCGFSLSSISIFINSDLRNIYVYKSRLKSIIAKGESPRKEEYLRYFA